MGKYFFSLDTPCLSCYVDIPLKVSGHSTLKCQAIPHWASYSLVCFLSGLIVRNSSLIFSAPHTVWGLHSDFPQERVPGRLSCTTQCGIGDRFELQSTDTFMWNRMSFWSVIFSSAIDALQCRHFIGCCRTCGHVPVA